MIKFRARVRPAPIAHVAAAFAVGLLAATVGSTACEAAVAGPLGPRSNLTGTLLRDDVLIELVQEVSGDIARHTVDELGTLDRSGVTPGFEIAANLIQARANEVGLQDVTRESFPADGSTRYFGDLTQRQWIVHTAELWAEKPYRIRLTSYADLPMSLARNSTTADVTAELVDVGGGLDERDYANKPIAGKIVLTNGSPADVEPFARTHGAVGVVSSYSVVFFAEDNLLPEDVRDHVGWMEIPEAAAAERGGFAFLVTERRAAELRKLLAAGKVVLHAKVDAELKPGTMSTVSGVIAGSSAAGEEVLLTAHLDHYRPGANDNASGSAAILEIARSWNALIRAGVLPKPRRTVRFLWVREYTGSRAWFSRHLSDPVNRIVNLNLDMVGGSPALTNSDLFATYTPDSVASYLNPLLSSTFAYITAYNSTRYAERKDLQLVAVTGSRNPFRGYVSAFKLGSDHELFASLGKPSTIYASWPDDNYHASTDTPDKIDPTAIKRAIVAAMIPAVTIAYADDSSVPEIAMLAASEGRRRLAGQFASAISLAREKGDPMAGEILLRHGYGREIATVRSSLALGSRNAKGKTAVNALADGLQHTLDSELAAFRKALVQTQGVAEGAERNQEQSNIDGALVPVKLPGQQLVSAVSLLGEAALMGQSDTAPTVAVALKRIRDQAIERGRDQLGALAIVELPEYYVDGHRTIDDIRHEVEAEFGVPFPLDAMVEYFRVFERAGAMKLKKRGAQ